MFEPPDSAVCATTSEWPAELRERRLHLWLVGTAVNAPAVCVSLRKPPPLDVPRRRRREVCGVRAPQVPDVFVCGTAREDGLRIYAGRVGDSALIASPWTPESDDPLLAWAVLDCPSAYAIESVDHVTQIVVLASLTVELRERPRAGEHHVVAAWPVGSEGRKHRSASALYSATGRVLAVADSRWIELRDPATFGG